MGLVPLELHKLTRKKESSQTASLVWSAREGALIHYTITMTNESDDDDEGNDEEDEESSPPKNKAMARGADKRTKLSEAENEEEDDWKPSFNDKWDKGETATGGKKTTSTDADPWGAVDPFAEEGDPFVASQNRKSAAAGGAGKKTGGKNQAQNTADVEVEEEPTGPLSPEAQEWKKEWVELQEENKVLRERESGLNAITGKADYYEQEAQRLEQLLKDMQSEHKQILNQKLEIEAELKGRIAENEVLVQEVIATKLSLVDLATELDVTRKTTQQLRQRLGLVGSRAAAGEVAIARQMMGQQQPQQQQQQQRMPSQQQQQQQRPVSQQYQQQQHVPTQRRPPSSQNQAALQQQQTYSSPRGQPQQSRGMADPYAYQEEPVKVQPVRRAPKRA